MELPGTVAWVINADGVLDGLGGVRSSAPAFGSLNWPIRTPRLITFSNSLTFPGQLYRRNISKVESSRGRYFLRNATAYLRRKWSARIGTSLLRSCRGGRVTF